MLPAELRQRDRIEAGQEFDVERLDCGDYRLVRRAPRANDGAVDWLLGCPEKASSSLWTPNRPTRCEVPGRCQRPQRANETNPNLRVVAWPRRHEQDVAVDPIIIGEMRFGILLLPRGKKRALSSGVRRRCPAPPLPALGRGHRPEVGRAARAAARHREVDADQGQPHCGNGSPPRFGRRHAELGGLREGRRQDRQSVQRVTAASDVTFAPT